MTVASWPIRRSGAQVILFALLACAFIACSNREPAPNVTDLETRVQAWWSARQVGDVMRMYGMLEPSFRATTSLSEFGVHAHRLQRIAIEEPRIVEISPIPDSNRAYVTLFAKTRLPRTGQLVGVGIRDEWVLEDGQWWRVYVAPRTPFQ